MAVAVRTTATSGVLGNTPATVTVTPLVSDLWLVFVVESITALTQPLLTDNNPDGAGYGAIAQVVLGTSVRGTLYARNALFNPGAVTSTIVTLSQPSTNNGCFMEVVAVSGMGAAGQQAIKKNGSTYQQPTASSSASSAPSTTFPTAPLSTNLLLSFVGCLTNAPGLTAPTSFTRDQNVGNATPVGLDEAHVNSGVTATTIAWGTSVANWVAIAVELDATSSNAVDGTGAIGSTRRGMAPYSYPEANGVQALAGAVDTTTTVRGNMQQGIGIGSMIFGADGYVTGYADGRLDGSLIGVGQGISEASVPTVPPVVTVISPTPNTTPGTGGGFSSSYAVAEATPIILQITDASAFAFVGVSALFLDGSVETVYNGNFVGNYDAGSSQLALLDGVQLTVARDEGWPGAPSLATPLAVGLRIDAVDVHGNFVSTTLYWQMPLEVPVVAPPSPPPAVGVDHVAAALSRIVLQFRSS